MIRSVAKFELYDLNADPSESTNLITKRPDVATEMQEALLRWNDSVEQSVAGQDYPEGRVDPSEPAPRFWTRRGLLSPLLRTVERSLGVSVSAEQTLTRKACAFFHKLSLGRICPCRADKRFDFDVEGS